MDLFETNIIHGAATRPPLAARMRPKTLDDFAGQEHIMGPGKLLRRAIQSDQLSSLIFYGPPGTGKTTLARIIAQTTKATFHSINAVLTGIKDIREAIVLAKEAKEKRNQKFILFIDEVHRFNKSQQDALLPNVENGTMILIGATTENPYFEVNKALISRSRVFQLNPLGKSSIKSLLKNALADSSEGYGEWVIKFDDEALDHIVSVANGDARAALNALELAVEPELHRGADIHITLSDAEESIQKKAILYDKDGDSHYDTISAFIKSIRGSDPDASLFWMAKMLYAGEDPKFIFRRMLILASEDIGLANPDALSIVMSASQAFDYVGMPEGRFHLAQACLYLATSPKSNSTLSFFDALKEVEQNENNSVPVHLKDATRDGEEMGHGAGYQYPHAHKDHWVAQQYLPDGLQGKVFYTPSHQGYENKLSVDVQRKKEIQLTAMQDNITDSGFHYPEKKGLNDYWIRRSLASTKDWLSQIRELMFSKINLPLNSLVLDVSGEKNFLSWEACRLFSNGGIWSLCSTGKGYKQMKEWTSGFNFNYKPQIVRISDGDPEFAWLGSDKHSLKFNLILGYNLSEGEIKRLKPILLEVRENHLGENFEFVFAEVNTEYYHAIQKIVQFVVPEERELLEKIQVLESDFRTRLKSKPGSLQTFLESLGFRNIRYITHTLSIKRKLARAQVEAWLKDEGPSRQVLDHLRDSLSDSDWTKLVDGLLQNLPDREVPWSQEFRVYRGGENAIRIGDDGNS